MGALGDYIHLTNGKYIESGINENGKGNNFDDAYSAAESLLNTRIGTLPDIFPGIITKLETRLKRNTVQQQKNDQAKINSLWQSKINEMYNFLAKRTTQGLYGRYVGQNTLHSDTNSSQNIKIDPNATFVGPSNYYTGKGYAMGSDAQKNQAIAQYNEAQTLIDQINKNQSATPEELTRLEQLLSEGTRGTINSSFVQGNQSIQSIIGRAQFELDNYKMATTYTDLIGTAGEALVAMCDDTIENLAENNVDKVVQEHLSKSVIGGQQSDIRVKKSAIAADLSKHLRGSNASYYFGKTQNKVDVKIKIDDTNLFANVKHYSLPQGGSVTLQSSVSLLATLVLLESAEQFGTHWLNLHSLRGKNLTADKNKADALVKKEVAYEALVSGNPFKKNVKRANIFVFINRATGDVFVQSTKKILSDPGLSRFSITPQISRIAFTNTKITNGNERTRAYIQFKKQKKGEKKVRTEKYETYQSRIEDILMQVHHKKLAVSLNINPSK